MIVGYCCVDCLIERLCSLDVEVVVVGGCSRREIQFAERICKIEQVMETRAKVFVVSM